MRLRKPDVQRHEPRLRPEAEEREQESDRGPLRRKMRAAHGIEGKLPTAALHHAEAQQNCDRPDVRDQQVEKARAADLGKAVLRGDQKVGGERHGLPRHHERVGVIGQQHETHAGEEQVVLQAQQARRGAVAAAEVAGGKDRNARRGGPEQKEKKARQRIAPHVHGQVGQPDRQA